MKCPNCNVNLLMTQRENVEIDYCPECRGVWLDRGELDKIIERAAGVLSQSRQGDPRIIREGYPADNDQTYKKKKRESFLGDLFDF